MSSGDLIPKSGLCCAVASCKQHSGNAIEEGYNISFHKFPKDLQLQKIWAQKCKIVGTWNPQSYVCSMHFSPDGFVQDLKAELCGYLPSYRHLRQDVIPTLNLQIDSEKTSTKCSSSIDPKTAQHVRDILTKAFPSRFSSNELFKKKEKKKKQKYWSREEIASAFTLIYHSKKAYAYLKNELHYSLPGIAYIQRWAKSINMKKGLNEDILKIMKLNSDNIEDDEKLTVLMFGEIKVCSKVEYDVLNDEIVGPHNQMQIVMAQGISSKWKQPIFVDFDVNMTKTILYNIIDKLDNIGYKVICCVTNCSSKNVELWNQLGVTFENPTFFIPNGRKIVFIPDSSHLLMLLRNCFLDTGFTLNGADINKKPIKALIAKTSSEIGVYSKLRKEHISCKGPQRENFKLAKELLSHSTALALQHYRPTADYQVLDDTAEFIKLISNFFKFTNVSELKDNGMFKSPFGMYLYEQNKILNETYSVIKLMKCKGNNNSNLLMFQKCIMMYINSIKILYLIIKENYGIDHLLTTKVNNNALDYLFHQLCFTEDCPSALNAVDRLRMIILGIYPSNKTNIKDYNQDEFIVAQVFKLTEINLNDEHNDREDSEESDTDTIDENKFIVTHKDENKKEMELNAIEYLAGWVALKYKSKIPEIGYTVACNESNNSSGQDIMMPSWMNHLSYDRLIIPSNDFKKMILRVEWLFNKFTKKRKNPEGSDVVAKLTNKMFSRMPVEKKFKGAIQTYIKQRIIIRMKYFNYRVQLLKTKKKIKKSKNQKIKKLKI